MSSAALFFIGLIAAFQVGDCTITFSTPATASHTISPSVVEGANVAGSTVYTVVATTTGMTAAPAAATITFSIVVGAQFFGNTVGAITNTAVLDYETASTYVIHVKGLDDAVAPASATVTLTLSVTAAATDPYFPALVYCATLSDETASGTTVTTIAATDPNSDTLTYSISAGSNTNTDFAISAAGVITAANKLYRQQTPSYTLVIYAADATLSGTTTLNVCVGSSTYCTACSSSSGTAAIAASILLTLSALLHVL